MTHDQLMAITADMPMKEILVGGLPYLQRYFVGEDERGQCWLHRFLRADSERHLHRHPWHGTSMILCGRYTEQLRPVSAPNTGELDRIRYLSAGDTNEIFPETLHRIIEVEPNTWTVLHIRPGRRDTWSFVSDDGSEVVMQASPADWFMDFKARMAA